MINSSHRGAVPSSFSPTLRLNSYRTVTILSFPHQCWLETGRTGVESWLSLDCQRFCTGGYNSHGMNDPWTDPLVPLENGWNGAATESPSQRLLRDPEMRMSPLLAWVYTPGTQNITLPALGYQKTTKSTLPSFIHHEDLDTCKHKCELTVSVLPGKKKSKSTRYISNFTISH